MFCYSLLLNRNLNKNSSKANFGFFTKRKTRISLILSEFASYFPQHCLYFLPLINRK